ncbi:Rv3235 family protein [Leucobacter rhizosphaerae]|uniref:Rv3235 family protein n=1 Tax=Leucobacter rhizosphaerae TaxID=2932245 RepID=A0ABY4FZD4_9MICO|nr:Rv3235 family protein [Leucobacter rhizosphaerae]UOQ61661.1 Rv3235 family protein [Leucobacter rhizosphaerae]
MASLPARLAPVPTVLATSARAPSMVAKSAPAESLTAEAQPADSQPDTSPAVRAVPRRHLHAVPPPGPARISTVPRPAAPVPLAPVPAPLPAAALDIPPPDLSVVRLLAVYSYEILDGSRAVGQLGGWITREVAEHLTARRAARTERRTLTRDTRRSVPVPGPVHLSRPSPLVTEVTIILTTPARSTAVAMRLEYLRQRWRATTLTVL